MKSDGQSVFHTNVPDKYVRNMPGKCHRPFYAFERGNDDFFLSFFLYFFLFFLSFRAIVNGICVIESKCLFFMSILVYVYHNSSHCLFRDISLSLSLSLYTFSYHIFLENYTFSRNGMFMNVCLWRT